MLDGVTGLGDGADAAVAVGLFEGGQEVAGADAVPGHFLGELIAGVD